jgi:hypothetical protein
MGMLIATGFVMSFLAGFVLCAAFAAGGGSEARLSRR